MPAATNRELPRPEGAVRSKDAQHSPDRVTGPSSFTVGYTIYKMQEVANEMWIGAEAPGAAMNSMLTPSISSTAAPSAGRIVQKKILKERKSDEGNPKKCLDKGLDAAAMIDVDGIKGPRECIMPYDLNVVNGPPPPTPAVSSSSAWAGSDDPFWQRMQWMMEKQSMDMNSNIDAIARYIAGVGGRLKVKMDLEKKAREDESVTEAMKDLTKRVAELETRPRTEESRRAASSGWRPAHVILGGWPRGTDKLDIERQALESIQSLPANERGADTAICAQEA